MKTKTIYSFIVILLSFPLIAQEVIDRAKYKITYNSYALNKPHTGVKKSDNKILEIGDSISKFYSASEQRALQIRDSLFKLGYTFEQVRQKMGAQERSLDKSVVYKGYPGKNKVTFTGNIGKKFEYEEVFSIPEWEIMPDEKTTILEFQCQKAKAHFRGRNWIVWFTPEIPISEGPWKLSGLPGLILQADDEKNEFGFKCIGIVESDQPMIKDLKKSIKTTRSEYLKLDRSVFLDPDKTLSQIYGVEIKKVSPDTQERSYNPIEF